MPTVSLHVRERIEPRTIVEAVRRRNGADPRMPLFAAPEENPEPASASGHRVLPARHRWTNHLIAGDSLRVMNSLIEKEALGGQVRTVCLDPPCAIRYGSNFRPSVQEAPCSIQALTMPDLRAPPAETRPR